MAKKSNKRRVGRSFPPPRTGGRAAPTHAAHRAAAPPKRLLQGPWGELETCETYLEAPDALLDLLSLPSQHTVWNFLDMDRAQILNLFEESGMDSKKIESLSRPSCWKDFGRTCRIFPDAGTVLSLSDREKSTIYRVLSRWEENPSHRYPIVLEDPGPNGYLSDLPPEVVNMISSLAYREGSVTLFSDFPLLLSRLTHPEVERKLLRALTRTRTILARVRISPKSDIPALCRYWSAGGRNADPLPLVQSIASTDGVDTLDIAHLLPAAARGRLYSYPGISDAMTTGRAPDGIWTALNFFNRSPIPIYLMSPNLEDYLTRMFRKVEGPYTFGDLLLIGNPNTREICHACIAIAGDIVYTKESADFFSPWILSNLDRVVQYQVRSHEKAEIIGFRRVG
ncbi:MAG: hypothetical protein P1V20_27920 [Verrucomicrobiales bacterium]|nr:hypothetical protein [Verrucomicrobiales bacterium]